MPIYEQSFYQRMNMDPINANTGMSPDIYAMKKATEVQEIVLAQLMESILPSAPAQGVSGAELTGIGQNLDIKA